LMKRIEIVGVATDDPAQKYTSAAKRVWQYAHTQQEENMVAELAGRNGIPVFKGKVKSPEFYDTLKNDWKPDIIYMGTFGQLLDDAIITTPRLGVFNAHPADGDQWPSCVGPNPFEQMLEAHNPYCAIALHQTNTQFDNGDLTSFSQRLPIPYETLDGMSGLGDKVLHMHRITAPYAATLINSHLRSEIGMPLTHEQAYYADKFKPKPGAGRNP
jgi:methionyl-tRNA formyltransferase